MDGKSGTDRHARGSLSVATKISPEMSLEAGLKVVKGISSLVDKLELGGGLRKEAWLREIKG